MSKLSEQPAFPSVDTICPDGTRCAPLNEGMTLLQYYAGLAMQGFCSYDDESESHWNDKAERYAARAIKMADALIKELEKPTDQ